jgi:two-component system sensor histidine kinase/response regulator
MNQTEDLVEGFIVGGVDYITKPFQREELLIRVKNHLELAGSRKKIIEMNKNRDKLYSIIAHDIYSPLSNLSMLIKALADKAISPTCDEFDEIIGDLDKSTNSTISLLKNLLKWANMQSDTISLSPNFMDLYPLLLECTQLLQGNANSKTIKVELDVPVELQAYFDEVTIHTVFRNLIANAIKFTPKNGTIRIFSSVDSKFVGITVKDNGIGMQEDVIAKIFKDNVHHTSLGTNKEQGSGLGLLMVKDFVNRNKGQLEVKSEPEEGTEITVFLPLTKV